MINFPKLMVDTYVTLGGAPRADEIGNDAMVALMRPTIQKAIEEELRSFVSSEGLAALPHGMFTPSLPFGRMGQC